MTVIRLLSFRKLFSPTPRTFMISSIFWEDSRRINVYAGELEVRPPRAPTTLGVGVLGVGSWCPTARDHSATDCAAAELNRRRLEDPTASDALTAGWSNGRSPGSPLPASTYTRDMTIKRLDHVSVVVEDLAAAIAFFTALGMTLEGEAPVEGPWVDRVNGLENVKSTSL